MFKCNIKIMELTIDTLPKGTIKEIKAWAKNNDYKTPSKLKKEELISYLKGVHYERSNGINKEKICSNMKLDNLTSVYADDSIDWLMHLYKYGWAVTPIEGWRDEFIGSFFKWFEDCNSNFKANNHNTWKNSNMPILLHGILKHYFGHTEMQRS